MYEHNKGVLKEIGWVDIEKCYDQTCYPCTIRIRLQIHALLLILGEQQLVFVSLRIIVVVF